MTYYSVRENGEELQGYPADTAEYTATNAVAAVDFARDILAMRPESEVAVVVLAEAPRDPDAATSRSGERDPNLSTEARFDLVEDAWNEVTKGELNASTDPLLASLILAMWFTSDEYTRTTAVEQEDIDRDGDYGVAVRIATALSTLWFGWNQ